MGFQRPAHSAFAIAADAPDTPPPRTAKAQTKASVFIFRSPVANIAATFRKIKMSKQPSRAPFGASGYINNGKAASSWPDNLSVSSLGLMGNAARNPKTWAGVNPALRNAIEKAAADWNGGVAVTAGKEPHYNVKTG